MFMTSYEVYSSLSTLHLKVTMPIPRLNAKSSTFAPLTDKVVLPSTPSFALMVLSSTKTTSFVIGGSTLIALRLLTFTASMTTLLLNVLLPLEL